MHNAGMVNVTIRDVPDDVRDVLAARAAAHGMSLQEFLTRLLQRSASSPDELEVIERVREHKRRNPLNVTRDEIVAAVHEGRRE